MIQQVVTLTNLNAQQGPHILAIILAALISIIVLGVSFELFMMADPNNMDLGCGCVGVVIVVVWAVLIFLDLKFVQM